MESGPRLFSWLRSLLRAHGPVLALDLAGVRFIDCAGVGVLVVSCRAARQDGGRFFVVGLSPCARRIIEITRLQEMLGERDTEGKPLCNKRTALGRFSPSRR